MDDQEFLDKLKTVFNVCDEDDDGLIAVDHFEKLAVEHFGASGIEAVTGIINFLDPDAKGVINFDDFCEGVQQIQDLQSQVQSSFNGGSGSLRRGCSEDTLVPADCIAHISPIVESYKQDSSNSTYAEYDITDLPLNSSEYTNGDNSWKGRQLFPPHSDDEADSALSYKSSELNENSRHEITDEENFEDFGEIESEADVSDQGHLTPATARKHINHRKGDFRQHKRTPNRRLTSAAYASQLQRSAVGSPSSTRSNSFGSADKVIIENIDGNFQELNDRVKFMEREITSLRDNQNQTDTKHIRLKDENTILIQKVHSLEEHIHEMETVAEQRLREERTKHQEYVTKHEREKTAEDDLIAQKLKEYETLTDEITRLKSLLAKVKEEKMLLQEKYIEKQELCTMIQDDNDKLRIELQNQEESFKKERHSTGQLLDELGKELEELRRFKIEAELTQGNNMSELPARYQELQAEVKHLKESLWDEWKDMLKENRNLKDNNEEMNAQLLNQCMEEGRSLLKEREGVSIAEELEDLSKDELLAALREEQNDNIRLKSYVDRILLTIMEKNPSLLEVAH
ncbi:rab11 family-interacting protein 4A isoform X5 [Patella vulgata]|uniref:rab11 family-interacting protein 4A isoform X5 n=1 Tax=Patella vulgata TaxID=6465 RepID=UPI00218084E5|nr:rab11 family-interacting protein 4A isoform X5 [Patella vulgata]